MFLEKNIKNSTVDPTSIDLNWTLPPSMLGAKIFSDQTMIMRLQALLNSRIGDIVIKVLMDFYDGIGRFRSDGYCFYSQFGENKSLMNKSGFNYNYHTIFDRQHCEGMIRAYTSILLIQ